MQQKRIKTYNVRNKSGMLKRSIEMEVELKCWKCGFFLEKLYLLVYNNVKLYLEKIDFMLLLKMTLQS